MDYNHLVFKLHLHVIAAHQYINPARLSPAQCACGWVAGPFDTHGEHLARKVADWFMQELDV